MSILDLDHLWAEAHTLHFSTSKFMPNTTNQWISRMQNTPNGQLLATNGFFRLVQSNPKSIHILHVTQDVNKIIENGAIHPSAGCLVGCVYGTQLYPTSDGSFMMHNLGEHVLTREAPLTGSHPTPLVIEVSFNNTHEDIVLAGLNYLKLGKIHHTIYENLKHLLSNEERQELESLVSERIKRSLGFINLCIFNDKHGPNIESREFIKQVNLTVPQLPILGYIFFEVISEYTMLYSTDRLSEELKERREFNNTIYKSFLLDIYRKIGKFKLSDFNPTGQQIIDRLSSLREAGQIDINTDNFFDYLRDRISNLVTTLFMTNPDAEPNWLNQPWNYNGLSKTLMPLTGHTIHRELRNFHRYKDFYFYFDQLKALSAWNYWNKMGISLPFNGPLHKGEIGINPAFQGATYRVFSAVKSNTEEGRLYIDKELSNVRITPRLTDLQNTAMRSMDHIKPFTRSGHD